MYTRQNGNVWLDVMVQDGHGLVLDRMGNSVSGHDISTSLFIAISQIANLEAAADGETVNMHARLYKHIQT